MVKKSTPAAREALLSQPEMVAATKTALIGEGKVKPEIALTGLKEIRSKLEAMLTDLNATNVKNMQFALAAAAKTEDRRIPAALAAVTQRDIGKNAELAKVQDYLTFLQAQPTMQGKRVQERLASLVKASNEENVNLTNIQTKLNKLILSSGKVSGVDIIPAQRQLQILEGKIHDLIKLTSDLKQAIKKGSTVEGQPADQVTNQRKFR